MSNIDDDDDFPIDDDFPEDDDENDENVLLPEDRELQPVSVLFNKTLRQAAQEVTEQEARFLVRAYYAAQKQRMRTRLQLDSLKKFGEAHEIIDWVVHQAQSVEDQVKTMLAAYAGKYTVGRWAISQKGIGPVITAGLIAFIDIDQTPTVSDLWSFAGMNPNAVWKEKTKRPWNAQLKVLCWKIGDSFMKQSTRPGYYTDVYLKRKALEIARNDNGDFADLAKKTFETTDWSEKKPKKYKKKFKTQEEADAYEAKEIIATKAYYESGKLPPGRIELRARRVAVKLFLSHFWHVLAVTSGKTIIPNPYAIDILSGHTGYKAPPGWPMAGPIDPVPVRAPRVAIEAPKLATVEPVNDGEVVKRKRGRPRKNV